MSRMLHNMPSKLVRLLAVAAIVAVMIPTWSMAMCAMDMDLGAMLACDSVWLASDAESGTLVALWGLALLMMGLMPRLMHMATHATPLMAPIDAPDPRPPDDPLMGRLTL